LIAPLKVAGPTSQASLAQRHNLAGFLLPLYLSLQETTDSALHQRMLPGVRAALKELN